MAVGSPDVPIILYSGTNPETIQHVDVFINKGVIGVTSVDEVSRTLREAPVRCTIADHMLKGQTGIDAAKEMKRIKPMRRVEVLLLASECFRPSIEMLPNRPVEPIEPFPKEPICVHIILKDFRAGLLHELPQPLFS